jgi:FtsZ-interacting cell division protein YlmF
MSHVGTIKEFANKRRTRKGLNAKREIESVVCIGFRRNMSKSRMARIYPKVYEDIVNILGLR